MTGAVADLRGKVAVVTGGSRGLGYEMVRAFADAGADVVIASRKLDNCEAVAEEVRAASGVRALPIGAHIGRWADCDALIDRVYEEFGRVDILINNAGMAPLYPSLSQVSEELFDKVVGVNLKGPFRLCAVIGERMAAADGGAIVNISTLGTERPQPTDLPYAAAKSGLNTLTKGFAMAYGPKVRVNGILVGPFLTDISKAWDVPAFEAWAKERYPLQRLGQPPEIVGTVMYLVTDASSFTTGVVLPVDGGISVSSPFAH